MKARKQTILIIFSFACLPILLAMILCVFAFALPAQYSDTFLGEMKYKMARLEETDGKRIIVIGGSSVAFGQDSALMEKYLPEYSVVNFGLYGDLGTKLMLDIAEDSIRSDDIVIVAPETDSQTLSMFFSGDTFWQAADGNFELLSHIKSENIGSVIGSMPEFSAKKAGYAINGSPDPDDIYRRGSFNDYGDIESGLRPFNIMRNGFDVTRPVSFDSDIVSDEFIDYLNDFALTVKKRGASVYYRMCPVNDRAVTGDYTIDGFYDYLDERLNFDILGDPNNSIIGWKYFYDSNFHLNDSGVVLNTRQLIRDIKVILTDSSPTDIAVPAAPDSPITEVTGDNSDADMFTYSNENGSYVITGLTEAGLLRKELIIPAKYNGVLVTGFTQTAFANATNLNRLTLQENITMIYDRSFEGCTALTQLVLLHDAPNKCMVGNDLFGNAMFNVYVPAELVNRYRVNYFWAQYGARIRPIQKETAYAYS